MKSVMRNGRVRYLFMMSRDLVFEDESVVVFDKNTSWDMQKISGKNYSAINGT